GGDREDQGIAQMRRGGLGRVAHLLRLDGEDRGFHLAHLRARPLARAPAEIAHELPARGPVRLHPPGVGPLGTLPREPAADGAPHVAAADESDPHAAFLRSPKIAVPILTIVAPSAIAASKSSVMPMERVSSGTPAALIASNVRRSSANCARRSAGLASS